jgi:hypothetical protein
VGGGGLFRREGGWETEQERREGGRKNFWKEKTGMPSNMGLWAGASPKNCAAQLGWIVV